MAKLTLMLGVLGWILGTASTASGITLFANFPSGVVPADNVPLVVGGPGEFAYLQDFVARHDVLSPLVEIPLAPSGVDPAASVTVRIHAGPVFDLAGSVIASIAISVPVAATSIQLDFSGVLLTAGQSYGVSVSTDSQQQALWLALPSGQIPFLRSDAGGDFSPIASDEELALRVTGDAPVPEPATGVLLGLGLVQVAALRSRGAPPRAGGRQGP